MRERVRATAVCVHAGALLCVRLRDPATRVERLFPPGGAIEAGESPARAAARETLEETGYRVRIEAASEQVWRHQFVWAATTFDVTTHYFRARLADLAQAPASERDPEVAAVVWLPLEQVERTLAFDATICRATCALIVTR